MENTVEINRAPYVNEGPVDAATVGRVALGLAVCLAAELRGMGYDGPMAAVDPAAAGVTVRDWRAAQSEVVVGWHKEFFARLRGETV